MYLSLSGLYYCILDLLLLLQSKLKPFYLSAKILFFYACFFCIEEFFIK